MRLSVTTPRGAIVETETEEIVAPGAEGEFGVLPGHVPFLSVLKPGVFIYKHKDGTRIYAVGEGVLEVTRTDAQIDKILVLVERATAAKDVDAPGSATELASLDQQIAQWKKEDATAEYQGLLARRAWVAAQVDAAARIAPH
jgi:F-type H+-transporting ATPase subunit epsilon